MFPASNLHRLCPQRRDKLSACYQPNPGGAKPCSSFAGRSCSAFVSPDAGRPAAKGRAGRIRPPDGFGAVLLTTLGFQGTAWLLMLFLFLATIKSAGARPWGFAGRNCRMRCSGCAGRHHPLPVVLGCSRFRRWVLTKNFWAGPGAPKEGSSPVTLLANTKSWWMRVYLGAFAVVLAPVAEEFIFRGMLYPFRSNNSAGRGWLGSASVLCLR